MNEKPKFAAISALVIEALAPMLRECDESSSSMAAFINQAPTEDLGLYILPSRDGSKGTLVVAVEQHRMVAIADPNGRAKEALKIYLPKGAIKAATRKTTTLQDENGEAFSVVVQPAPGMLHCSDGFVMIATDQKHEWQQKEFPGTLGSWFNGDHENYIDMASYRMEDAKDEMVKTINSLIDEARAANSVNSGSLKINLGQISAIAHAAQIYEQAYRVGQSAEGRPLCFRSEDGNVLGVLMPLKDGEVESAGLDVFNVCPLKLHAASARIQHYPNQRLVTVGQGSQLHQIGDFLVGQRFALVAIAGILASLDARCRINHDPPFAEHPLKE